MRRSLATLVATTLLAVAAGCTTDGSGPPLEPDMAAVSGNYAAADDFGALTFTTTTDGETTDWLAAGADLELTLADEGTVTGRLFVPGADEDGGDFDQDMAGRWSLQNSVVQFEQPADTFVRDMDFTYLDGTLTGERTFSDTRVRVVLVRR